MPYLKVLQKFLHSYKNLFKKMHELVINIFLFDKTTKVELVYIYKYYISTSNNKNLQT